MAEIDEENDLEEQEEYEETDKEEKRLLLLKRLGIVFLLIIGIIIILMMIKGCQIGKNDYKNTTQLLEGAKEYYDNNKHLMPSNKGTCDTVTLKTLLEKGILFETNFEGCDSEKTYVKVCMLESGSLHWTPVKLCGDEDTEALYGQWKEGKESDLTKDESDVKFAFLAQYLDLSDAKLGEQEEYWKDEIPYEKYKTIELITYYRYRDLEYIWNTITKYYYTSGGEKTSSSAVKEYYKSAPSSKYTNKDSANKTAAKWYKVTGRKYYTVDGIRKAVSAENFEYTSEYPNKELADTFKAYRTKTVWTETSKPTTTSPTHYYYCTKSASDTTSGIISLQPCSQQLIDNPLYGYQAEDFYSCTGKFNNKVSANATCYKCSNGELKEDNSSCGSYTWSTWSKTKCDTSKTDTCQMFSQNVYYWYNSENESRLYYPSGSSSASNEKVYYISSPADGAIKDDDTITTAYKWYRTVTTETNNYYSTSPESGATKTDTKRYTDWTEWSLSKPSDLKGGTRSIESKIKVKLKQILTEQSNTWKNLTEEYLTEEELFIKLKEKGYEVHSLSVINASGELQYLIKLYYRNKEK